MWLVVPLPAWPSETAPGLALASASSAFQSAYLLLAGTTTTIGTGDSMVSGRNSGIIDGLPAISAET